MIDDAAREHGVSRHLIRAVIETESEFDPLALSSRGAASLSAMSCFAMAEGKLRAVTHATFPLAEAARAHALTESSAHVGKIVLRVGA